MINQILKIKNFGPIKESEIKIAPFTVFVGKNSSGKSFAATLIYVLFKFKTDFEDEDNFKYMTFAENSLKQYIENCNNEYEELENIIEKQINNDSNIFIIPQNIFNNIVNNGILNYFGDYIEKQLKERFYKDISKLIKFEEKEFIFELNNLKFIYSNDNLKIENSYDFTKDINEGQNLIFFKGNYQIDLNSFLNKKNNNKQYICDYIYKNINNFVLNKLNLIKSYYIPAARNIFFPNMVINDYPYETKELTFNLLTVDSENKNNDFYDLGIGLQKDIIGDGKMKEHMYALPPFMVSTSIQETGAIMLYLKFKVKRGDVLIIEEPEAHLHPQNQRILVKYFVEAINSGLNIIITTHSDYIIEQINNYVRLSNASKKAYEKFNYTEKNALQPEDLAIYHFKEEGEYSFITKKVDINYTGFQDENFNEILEDLFDESDYIIDSMLGDINE